MHVLAETIGSSIGKKLLMALTGVCFVGFLAVHLAGNLSVFGGADMFNSYVEHLHALGVLINIAEIGLLLAAIVHVTTGTLLVIQNFRARPTRYSVKKSNGGRTIGSRTMPYTGFFILAFIIFHLNGFHFVDHTGRTVFEIMTSAFASPLVALLYVAAVVVVALHIRHGFWSLFQTIGANHPVYMPIIRKIGIAFAIIVGIGFGAIPVYIAFI
ncbi:MAG: succinate dehydrogenase cytochrome b subunit [Thermodesulfobacteriota bacterium]|nr:succinate dehydrogenase cytochrome b subunit [Thermodesulfobacteriota bacterium]